MKEFSKKSLAMLFAMFMLGACSTSESLSAGDVANGALDDALGELTTDVKDMTHWSATTTETHKDDYQNFTDTKTVSYYFDEESKKYAMVSATVQNGTMVVDVIYPDGFDWEATDKWTDEDWDNFYENCVTYKTEKFNNKVVEKGAEEGTYSTATPDNLAIKNGNNKDVTGLDDYKTVYTFDVTSSKQWNSEDDKWYGDDEYPDYYTVSDSINSYNALVKSTDSTMYIFNGSYQSYGNTFSIYGDGMYDEETGEPLTALSDSYATKYSKK